MFVITGQLAAGKSTVARALTERFPRGYHVDVDALREMVTSGHASPLDWTDETTRQFELATRAAAMLARLYSDAGFAVAVEGGLDLAMIDPALRDAAIDDRAIVVVLRPPLEVALERNRTRRTKAFDTAILEPAMRQIDAGLDAIGDREGWHVIDNGAEALDATVDRILALRR